MRGHVTVLTCANANGEYIPSLYIFKGRQRKDVYIFKCEVGAVYAMQDKAWMASYNFFKWLDYFFQHLQLRKGISKTSRHLLILDGHGSLVWYDLVYIPGSNLFQDSSSSIMLCLAASFICVPYM
jgi:hypothetical protein